MNYFLVLFFTLVFSAKGAPPPWMAQDQWGNKPLTRLLDTLDKDQVKKRPKLVYDLDNTLALGVDDEEDFDMLQARTPDFVHVPFWNFEDLCFNAYAFFPDNGETLMMQLMLGFSIDFFSAGGRQRNDALLPLYLKTVLAPYSTDMGTDWNRLQKMGLFRIYSNHHLATFDDPQPFPLKPEDKKLHAYLKKDLSFLGPLDNVALIDDNPTYAATDQLPLIALDPYFPKLFADFLSTSYNSFECYMDSEYYKGLSPRHLSPYIMGITWACHNHMQNTQQSLRQALGNILPMEIRPETGLPLYLFPRHNDSPVQTFLEKGQALLAEFKITYPTPTHDSRRRYYHLRSQVGPSPQ